MNFAQFSKLLLDTELFPPGHRNYKKYLYISQFFRKKHIFFKFNETIQFNPYQIMH